MKDFEVYKDSLEYLPFGFKNNNPANIRFNVKNNWKGQKRPVKGFCSFDSFDSGLRAIVFLTLNYLYKYRLFEFTQFFRRFAPVGDGNNPNTYAFLVSNITGLKKLHCEIEVLRVELPLFINALFIVENGVCINKSPLHCEYLELLFNEVRKYFDEWLNYYFYVVEGKKQNL